jgi:uncharacterized membrane protein YqhA
MDLMIWQVANNYNIMGAKAPKKGIMLKKILNFLDYVLFAGFMFYVFFGLKPTIDWLLLNH